MSRKIALVTGCSSGIGLAIAISFAKDEEQRFKVHATIRDTATSEALEAEAGEALNNTLFVQELDVTDDESVFGLITKILQEDGKIDILVCNAGVLGLGVFDVIPMDEVIQLFHTNVFGTMRVIQACLPQMKRDKNGHICIISSVLGNCVRVPFLDVYTSSKFAIDGFAQSLHPVLKEFNINVSMICPSSVKTKLEANVSKNNLGSILPGGLPSDRRCDAATAKVFQKSMKFYMKHMTATQQSPGEVAEVVKTAVVDPKPSFRYFTNEKDMEVAKTIFRDPTGITSTEELHKATKRKGFLA